MSTLMHATDSYRAAFEAVEQELAASGPAWLRRVRREAMDRFEQLGFPTTDDEEWRFTNVAPIASGVFTAATSGSLVGSQLTSEAACGCDAHRVVFVNGHYAPQLSDVGTLPRGVVVTSLADALRRGSDEVEEHLTRHAPYRDHAFTALNTAFFRDGAFVSIGRSQVVEKPIHLLFLDAAEEQT